MSADHQKGCTPVNEQPDVIALGLIGRLSAAAGIGGKSRGR